MVEAEAPPSFLEDLGHLLVAFAGSPHGVHQAVGVLGVPGPARFDFRGHIELLLFLQVLHQARGSHEDHSLHLVEDAEVARGRESGEDEVRAREAVVRGRSDILARIDEPGVARGSEVGIQRALVFGGCPRMRSHDHLDLLLHEPESRHSFRDHREDQRGVVHLARDQDDDVVLLRLDLGADVFSLTGEAISFAGLPQHLLVERVAFHGELEVWRVDLLSDPLLGMIHRGLVREDHRGVLLLSGVQEHLEGRDGRSVPILDEHVLLRAFGSKGDIREVAPEPGLGTAHDCEVVLLVEFPTALVGVSDHGTAHVLGELDLPLHEVVPAGSSEERFELMLCLLELLQCGPEGIPPSTARILARPLA